MRKLISRLVAGGMLSALPLLTFTEVSAFCPGAPCSAEYCKACKDRCAGVCFFAPMDRGLTARDGYHADITSIGATVEGNSDGSIPPYAGMEAFSQDDLNATKPLDTITHSNQARFSGNLSEGHKALLANPSYRMPIFKSVRSAFYPKAIQDATKANAKSAKLSDGLLVTGAKLGFPFPVPQSGSEVVWNHRLRYRADSINRTRYQTSVSASGNHSDILRLQETIKFKYANLKQGEGSDIGNLAYSLINTTSPPRHAGTAQVLKETFGKGAPGMQSWIYEPGLRRVERAPEVGFDYPVRGSDDELISDQADMFSGSLERYDWKLVGKKEIYIPYNEWFLDQRQRAQPEALLKPSHLDQDVTRYELHRVWVVDATLKPGQRHVFKRRTFYVDEDSWTIAIVDCYDNRDQLWKVQEAHLVMDPRAQSVQIVLEDSYDLQTNRYFVTGVTGDDPTYNQEVNDQFFSPDALAKHSHGD